MQTKTSYVLVALILVLAIAGIFVFIYTRDTNPAETVENEAYETVEARIGQGASALGVQVIPREIIEDSRCPADVTCIQAGTVAVRSELVSGMGTSSEIFVLNLPITTEAEVITLAEVRPHPVSGNQIADADYVFTFKIQKR